MPPVRRRLLNLLTFLSLVLLVGVLVFGVWGYREGPREVRFEWVGRHHTLALLSDRGAMAVVYSSGWPAHDWVNERPLAVVAKPVPLTKRNALVFELTEEQWTLTDGATRATVRYQGVLTNFLYAAVFTAALPGWWLLRRLARRGDPDACPTCGYDLRATPDRCPECGHIPAAAGAATASAGRG
jgi:hypothetical protein